MIRHEQDVVIARRRARQIAQLLQFDSQDQARISTAVSEVARNAYVYAGGGRVEYSIQRRPARALLIRISDTGPGIQDLDLILSGRYQSKPGGGGGLIGARRLMDRVDIDSRPGAGCTVLLSKNLPQQAATPTPEDLAAIASRIAGEPQDLLEEMRHQNQDLMQALEGLREGKAALEERQDELVRLNRELEETNRGVLALYAELDEKAERLRQADQMKSRFLSYMSHEFRTPLNGIIGLTRLLLHRDSIQEDGEAVKQIRMAQRSAEELTEMVNDLLDLAKAEAGKLTVVPTEFEASALLGTLRGMFRPLQTSDSVSLVFETCNEIPPLRTDEAKLAQILRNFISNALKFTERGEVRVSAKYDRQFDAVTFSVKDTGIGIPREHQSAVFEEFSQIENPLQRKAKGTGLGLPLSKKLALVLKGNIWVTSAPGEGSEFSVTVPRVFADAHMRAAGRRTLLIIDDEEVSRYLLRTLLAGPYDMLEAAGGVEGLKLAREQRPDLIFLDLKMPDIPGQEVLETLRSDPATRDIPVVIATSYHPPAEEEGRIAGQAVTILRKDELARSESLVIDFGPPLSVTIRRPNQRQEMPETR